MTARDLHSTFSRDLVLGPHRELFDYWLSIFPGEGLPGRQHFDPIAIPDLLPMIYLVDVVRSTGADRYRFRLLGTAITERAGRDMTGRWLDEVYPDAALCESIAKIYSEIVREQRPHVGQFNIQAPGRQHVRANRIVLPLAEDGTNVDMLLGMWVYDDEASKPPEGNPLF